MPKAENAFELTEKAVKIIDAVTVAPKERDEDRKPGLYLIVGYTASNDDLAMIDPAMKQAFYRERSKEPTQAVLPGTESTGLTELKIPCLNKPFKIDKQCIGYSLIVTAGIDEKSNIEVAGVDIDNFKIKLIDGGSVYFQYRIALHVSEAIHGKLSQLKNEGITISLSAPEAGQAKLAA